MTLHSINGLAIRLCGLLLLCQAVISCGTSVGEWPDWGVADSVATTTCSGLPKSNAKPFDFVFVVKAYSCMLRDAQKGDIIVTVLANSVSEAKTCALDSLGDPDGILFDAFDVREMRPFGFIAVDWTTCPNSDPRCITRVDWHVSRSAAMTCATNELEWYLETQRDAQGNILVDPQSGTCRVYDVSDMVIFYQNGSWIINDWAMDDLCPKGCIP